MPPSNLGPRASIATQWHCVGSPTACAPAVEQELQHAAHVVGRAADKEVVGRRAPRLAQPVEVRLEAAGGDDERLGANLALRTRASAWRDEAAVVELEVDHLGVVGDLDAERLGGGVVGVQSALPPPRKNALVRESCSVPPSGGWKRTPCSFIHGTWLGARGWSGARESRRCRRP